MVNYLLLYPTLGNVRLPVLAGSRTRKDDSAGVKSRVKSPENESISLICCALRIAHLLCIAKKRARSVYLSFNKRIDGNAIRFLRIWFY